MIFLAKFSCGGRHNIIFTLVTRFPNARVPRIKKKVVRQIVLFENRKIYNGNIYLM